MTLHPIRIALLSALFALFAGPALADSPEITVYKTPTCGCCVKWIDHLEAYGFEVASVDLPDTRSLKAENGVPPTLQACHTAKVGGYVVEGHVPAADIARLLLEKPEVKGLAVPGMPLGSPGMEMRDPSRHEAYEVLAFDEEGKTRVFATHEPAKDVSVGAGSER